MSSFNEVLSDVEKRLDLPAETRRGVLLDLAADLEGIKRAGLDSGLNEAAAHARALQFVDLSDEAVTALARELASPPRRWLESFSGATRSRGEQVVLVFVGLAMLQLGAYLFASGKIMDAAGGTVWLPLGALFATSILGFVHLYRHRVVGDDRSEPTVRRAAWAWRICALQLAMCVAKISTGAFAVNSLLGDASAFESSGSALQSAGMQDFLLLLQSQTAFLSFAGLGAAAAALLAGRLASSAVHLTVDEQQLRLDLHPILETQPCSK